MSLEIISENEFRSDRLLFRPIVFDDAKAIADLAGDYDVAKMTTSIPHPLPVLVSEAKLLINAARQEDNRFGFAICHSQHGLIGNCGIFKRSPDKDWEIGYWIGKPYWGQGYGTEVAKGLTGWGWVNLKPSKIIAGHFIDNPASGVVLQKAGYKCIGETESYFSIARIKKTMCVDYEYYGEGFQI